MLSLTCSLTRIKSSKLVLFDNVKSTHGTKLFNEVLAVAKWMKIDSVCTVQYW